MNVAAIIPARGGSKRLERKNLYPLLGKPLLVYAIEACRKSKFISEVFVSSDDQAILDVAHEHGAVMIPRSLTLSDDFTPKIVAVRGAVLQPEFTSHGPFDVIAVVQANSPEITSADLDKGILFLIENNLWEVMSADSNGIQNAAFRIIRSERLNNDFLSAHCGFVIAESKDVHTIEDIHEIEKKWRNR